jgi:hypothetical protein
MDVVVKGLSLSMHLLIKTIDDNGVPLNCALLKFKTYFFESNFSFPKLAIDLV